MNQQQQIIEERVNKLSEELQIKPQDAFARYTFSLFSSTDINEFDEEDYVDGHFDNQIDLVYIKENDHYADINLYQFKYANGYSSTALKLFMIGIEYFLSEKIENIKQNTNEKLKSKIIEFRDLRNEKGFANLNINFYFICNGIDKEKSDEFECYEKLLNQQYDDKTYKSVNFYCVGSKQIIEKINEIERISNKIDEKIPIIYDKNIASLIEYQTRNLKSIICTVNGSEIARIVNKYFDKNIFELNIREFLGLKKNSINNYIYHTCTNSDEAYKFWFLNNGITIVCERYEVNPDPDSPNVFLYDMQIINGCQTSKVLAQAQIDGLFDCKTNVLLRIIETKDNTIIDDIVKATNTQNQISFRDLKANDPIQTDMERAFKAYGFIYVRKNSTSTRKIIEDYEYISNENVAQAFLSVVLKKPSKARRDKSSLWNDYYDIIFDGGNIERYIIATLIYKRAYQYIREYVKTKYPISYLRQCRYLIFHISRITAYLIKEDENWNNIEKLQSIIHDIRNSEIKIEELFYTSLQILDRILFDQIVPYEDIVNYTKKDIFDEQINKYIHNSTTEYEQSPFSEEHEH